MIIGIGTDIVEISRVEKACRKDSFRHYCYTERERDFAGEDVAVLAGDFAVKEAVSKALGTGFVGFTPRQVEVLRTEAGQPYVVLQEGAKKRAQELGVARFFVSISDTKELVVATAVAESEG